MIKNVMYNEHERVFQKVEKEKFLPLTDEDKINHVSPFIIFLEEVIQKHSVVSAAGGDDEEEPEYIFYLSIGGNPEVPNGENVTNQLFQLFPNLTVKPGAKIYYVGIDNFSKIKKVIDYKKADGLIEVKLFNMFWLDDCQTLIESLKILVDFNSENDKCLGTICINFAKFKNVVSPVFSNLANIFPKFANQMQLITHKYFDDIKEKKAVYMHSFGFKNIEEKTKNPGKNNIVLVDTTTITPIISFQDIHQAPLSTFIENRFKGNTMLILGSINGAYKEICEEEGKEILEDDYLKKKTLYFNLNIYSFGIDDDDNNDTESLFEGDCGIPYIDLVDPDEVIIQAGKKNEEKETNEGGEKKSEEPDKNDIKTPKLPKGLHKGGNIIYEKIINPITGRKVKTNSRLGIKIISKYLNNSNSDFL